MATQKQREAARENVKKAQKKWRSMSTSARIRAQPEGRARKRPGTGGSGDFYRVEVRPRSRFTIFRTHDVGEKGHLERVAGRRENGKWATSSWLISKRDAHIGARGRLVIDRKKIRDTLDIRGPIMHKKADIFEAKPRRNVPESEKPTTRQKRARRQNIKKAQATRRQPQR